MTKILSKLLDLDNVLRKIKSALVIPLSGGVLLIIILSLYAFKHFNQQINLKESSELEVKRGTTFRSLVNEINSRFVTSGGWMTFYGLRLVGYETKLKAGTYEVVPGESLWALIKKSENSDTKNFYFTFIEGEKLSDIIQKLSANPTINSNKLVSLSNAELNSFFGVKHPSMEGLFFPDTYSYSNNDTALSILSRAKNKMDFVLKSEWDSRAKNSVVASPYKALILASIIEKETSVAYEREIISGVFSRRLQLGMRLQTDPTVIYGLGATFDGNIKKSHLAAYNPFNTYRIKGLPPTPIAMPGRASIRAALTPSDGDELYFVSRGDGTHKFSSTLKEHSKAVLKYQR